MARPQSKQEEADLLNEGEALLLATPSAKAMYFNEDGDLTLDEFRTVTLEGPEAMAYLLGVVRANNQLVHLDHARITKRFRPLSEAEDKNEEFWRNITIRVWNTKNISKDTASITYKDGDEYLRHDGGKYKGDTFDGRALEGFVPNIAHSPKHNEYRVQIVSVRVSEAMSQHVNLPVRKSSPSAGN